MGPVAAFQRRAQRLLQLRLLEHVRIQVGRYQQADATQARITRMDADHCHMVAVAGGHCGACAQAEVTAVGNLHVDLALQHHADDQAGPFVRCGGIGDAVVHIRCEQAHSPAQGLFVQVAMAGPLFFAQMAWIGTVVIAVSLAKTAVIGKREISGHRSALNNKDGCRRRCARTFHRAPAARIGPALSEVEIDPCHFLQC